MALNALVNKLFNGLENKWSQVGIYLALNAGDLITTVMNAKKYGVRDEDNPLPRYFMESYDPLQGMLYHKASYLLAIPVLYGTGKAISFLYKKQKNRAGKPINKRVKQNLENIPFYLANAALTYAVITNIINFYSPFK